MNIVLVSPEIPQNTGNIARTCAATGSVLHIVRPISFSLDDKYMKRAGLDYWFMTELHVHESFADFMRGRENARMFFATTKARRAYTDFEFETDDYLVFGRETKGLDEELIAKNLDRAMRIPMRREARSLNLANSVAIVVYEALRQTGFPGLSGESDYDLPEWKDYI